MKIRSIVKSLVLTLAIGVQLSSGNSAQAAEDGGYAGAPLQLGVGGRAVGMGGAFVAVADGPTGFWYNPAGVGNIRTDQIEAAWRAMSFDRKTGYIAFVHPFARDEAAMALSWTYAGVSDLYEYDTDGRRGDQLSNFNNAVTFTFGRRFTPVLSIGATARYVQQNIGDISAYSIGFDLGVHLKFTRDWDLGGMTLPTSKLQLGVVVQRLGQKYPWTTGEYWVKFGEPGSSFDERFPMIARIGAAANIWQERAMVSVDAEINEEEDARIHAGLEILPVSQLALRAGLDHTEPAFGAGFFLPLDQNKRSQLVFDYAFAIQPGPIDGEHVFSIGARF
ncbi:MAG: hypothetical protein Kow0074_18620 [Candidatus Zixiibacteriota bacterium]